MPSELHFEVIWAIWQFWANARVKNDKTALTGQPARIWQFQGHFVLSYVKSSVSRSAVRIALGGHLGDLAVLDELAREHQKPQSSPIAR